MGKSFKIFLFLFFFINNLYSESNTRFLSIYYNPEKDMETEQLLGILANKTIEIIKTKYENIQIIYDNDQIVNNSLKYILNYNFTNNRDALFIIDMTGDSNKYRIDYKFYISPTEILSDYYLYYSPNETSITSDDFQKTWDSIISEIIDKFNTKKNLPKLNLEKVKSQFKFNHDFPIANLGVSGISLKLYFDGRTSLKLFSLSPIDVRVTFYPLRYMETGFFGSFDINNMIYKYFEGSETKYFESTFNISYGVFIGLSFFIDITHYSIGLQFSNLYYDLNNTKYTRPDSINGYFLPQFALYQKIDIKIYKLINYSIFFNLKTLPLFYLSGTSFYSKPFSYDFITLELSLLGFSITL